MSSNDRKGKDGFVLDAKKGFRRESIIGTAQSGGTRGLDLEACFHGGQLCEETVGVSQKKRLVAGCFCAPRYPPPLTVSFC